MALFNYVYRKKKAFTTLTTWIFRNGQRSGSEDFQLNGLIQIVSTLRVLNLFGEVSSVTLRLKLSEKPN